MTVAVSSDSMINPRAPGASLKSEFVAFKVNRIVEAASHLFYERGYSSCTLDNVASQLSVTKPFLYSSFRNKEAILAAICEVGISEALAVLEDVPVSYTHLDVYKRQGWDGVFSISSERWRRAGPAARQGRTVVTCPFSRAHCEFGCAPC